MLQINAIITMCVLVLCFFADMVTTTSPDKDLQLKHIIANLHPKCLYFYTKLQTFIDQAFISKFLQGFWNFIRKNKLFGIEI